MSQTQVLLEYAAPATTNLTMYLHESYDRLIENVKVAQDSQACYYVVKQLSTKELSLNLVI